MAGLRFTDLQSRPTEFLDFTSLTLDEFQQLVPPFEAAFQARMVAWRLDGKPRIARRFTVYENCPLRTPEDRLLFMSLSRLHHRLPRGQAYPEVMQGTAQFHHEITDAFFPQADPVFHDPAPLDATVDMLDPQPTLVQGLVRPLLRQREILAAWLLGRHEDLHLRERERQEAQIL
jgi:hypothetical protein